MTTDSKDTRMNADEATGGPPSASERIDTGQTEQLRQWAKKLDSTPEQIKEAVQAVGDKPGDVEAHLKGVRSSVNSERVQREGGGNA